MKTIRRGTKLFNMAVDGAKTVRQYSLDNEFRGEKFEVPSPTGWTPKKELNTFKFTKLISSGNGTFKLRVHSNLWFTWSI